MAEETNENGSDEIPAEIDHEARAAEAERKLAFVRAGIDFEKGTGKLLYETYKGDPDPDAVKGYANDIGVDLTPPPANPADGDLEFTADELESSARRRGVATGSTSDDGTENPRLTAEKTVRESMVSKTREDALVDGLRVLATAAKNGDSRVMVGGDKIR